MSYRRRITELEQEVDGGSPLWARYRAAGPYALLAAACALLLAISTPKWVYYRDPVSRAKRVSYPKLFLSWLLLSSLAGGGYYLYLNRGSIMRA